MMRYIRYTIMIGFVVTILLWVISSCKTTHVLAASPIVPALNNVGVIAPELEFHNVAPPVKMRQPERDHASYATPTLPDSTVLKLTGIIAKQNEQIAGQSQELELYHERAIINADRKYRDQIKADSIHRQDVVYKALQADTIKQLRADKQIQATSVQTQSVLAKYFPLFMGIAMIIGGLIGIAGKTHIDERKRNLSTL